MSLPHILLGMLRAQPKSGYDLDKELKAVIHYFWETDLSRIYRTLNDLKTKGWVDFETVVQHENPNKKVYSITPTGLHELKRWLAEPGKRSADPTRNAFLAQLHFSGIIPIEDQAAVLEERRDVLREELAELERRAANLKLTIPFPVDALSQGVTRAMLSLEYGIRMYRAELAWTEDTLRLLGAGSPKGGARRKGSAAKQKG